MILKVVVALTVITIFSCTFLVLRNKARLKIRLLASFIAVAIVLIILVLLSFLKASGYRFLLGV